MNQTHTQKEEKLGCSNHVRENKKIDKKKKADRKDWARQCGDFIALMLNYNWTVEPFSQAPNPTASLI